MLVLCLPVTCNQTPTPLVVPSCFRCGAGGGGGSTAPAWVPAGAKIHIDFLGGVSRSGSQGRAWVDGTGEVGIETLLGSDPNTENGWAASGYDAADLTADGHVYQTVMPAFIGQLRSNVLSGATIRYVIKRIGPTITDNPAFTCISADGNDAIEVDEQLGNPNSGHAIAASWSGSLSIMTAMMVDIAQGTSNTLAVTFVSDRIDIAVNGSAAVSGAIDATDRPPGNPFVAAFIDTGSNQTFALQSITLYDPLPSTAGLSELSEPFAPPPTPAWVPENAKIHIDLLGGTPQGRAWVDGTGEVGIETLLGNDPAIDSVVGISSGYDSSKLTADGYNPAGGGMVTGFIGALRSKILAGATVRFATKQLSTDETISTATLLVLMSTDGNDGLEADLGFANGGTQANLAIYSYHGDTDFSSSSLSGHTVGAANVFAYTTSGLRFELAENGHPVVATLTMTANDRPAGNPFAAAYLDYKRVFGAIQSITLYDPLPSTTGLSELSSI